MRLKEKTNKAVQFQLVEFRRKPGAVRLSRRTSKGFTVHEITLDSALRKAKDAFKSADIS